MKYFIHSILFNIVFISVSAQQVPFTFEQLQPEMKTSMMLLSNDSLQGRLVGSPGEKIAYTYISQKFQQHNVLPKGEQKYLQPFTIKRFSVYTEGTYFELKKGGKTIIFKGSHPKLFPASVSGPGKAKAKTVFMGYGIISGDGSMNDYAGKTVKGKIAVFQSGYPSSTFSIHSAVAAASSLEAKVDTAIAHGAVGVLILHSDTSIAKPRYKKYVQKNQIRNIPVMHMITQSETDLFDRAELLLDIRANEVEIVGHNVVGYIDNKAQKTVVIGAHYDHLGYD
jgi:aminopeptidase YwaD